ncbi:GNAT family N-acetyltransferase [Saccharibacillus kuerlensis]|uniref:N-acetyltransferase n=1 Tax=Saccharibacillus kuerlensis TaxID=459527 RepID=A0ABQ2L3J3_9BACL|nr:GNAT family N-acetyltransferase [Saccharibacillus kuerlensis]GGO01211.1 N-acetyltransferase [Saccharibacillus kuerlensis]
MDFVYREDREISPEEVSAVFQKSGIKRPYEDLQRIGRMIAAADIVITAWDNGKMIGIARALTDYAYCCYLSDLAVDLAYQGSGIGRRLIEEVRTRIGEECSLVLLSAPGAVDYYPKVGFERTDKAFIIARQK